jgi:hypothetical protein
MMTNDTIQLYFLLIGALKKEYWKVVILVFGKVGRCYLKVDSYYNLKRGTWLWRAGGNDAALFEELHRIVD